MNVLHRPVETATQSRRLRCYDLGMHEYRFLSRDNALALLPFPESFLPDLDEALQAINSGQNGGKNRCIEELVRLNKKTKKKKSWKRFARHSDVDLIVEYDYNWFEIPADQHDFFTSFDAHSHGTPQSPMLRVHFRRCPGVKPNIPEGESRFISSSVRSCRSISIPIQCVLRGWGRAERGYMIYEHMFAPMDDAEKQFEAQCYIGLTSRDWLTRFSEHKRDALTGSNLLFHASLGSAYDGAAVTQRGMGPFEVIRVGVALYSELQYVNLSYDEAMEVEEKLVERTLAPKGLNMIPGGLAGMKHLHKLGFLARARVSFEDRDEAVAAYMRKHPRKGQPAPWVADNWEEDDYYEKVILSRQNTLSRDQVLAIRKYGGKWGFSTELIASLTSANERQIRDVLSGKHYSRIQ